MTIAMSGDIQIYLESIIMARNSNFSKSMHDLSKKEGSPCLNCIVNSTCRKSFIDKSACVEFARFIENLMIEARMIKHEG